MWVGRGGDKSIASKKKRTRKWEGLREDEGNLVSVAEGPVVSVCVENSPNPENEPDWTLLLKGLCGFGKLRDVHASRLVVPV